MPAPVWNPAAQTEPSVTSTERWSLTDFNAVKPKIMKTPNITFV